MSWIMWSRVAEASIKDRRLRRVLDDYTTPVGGLYVVYPSSRHLSPLVKAFIELAAERWSAAAASGIFQALVVLRAMSTLSPELSVRQCYAERRPTRAACCDELNSRRGGALGWRSTAPRLQHF